MFNVGLLTSVLAVPFGYVDTENFDNLNFFPNFMQMDNLSETSRDLRRHFPPILVDPSLPDIVRSRVPYIRRSLLHRQTSKEDIYVKAKRESNSTSQSAVQQQKPDLFSNLPRHSLSAKITDSNSSTRSTSQDLVDDERRIQERLRNILEVKSSSPPVSVGERADLPMSWELPEAVTTNPQETEENVEEAPSLEEVIRVGAELRRIADEFQINNSQIPTEIDVRLRIMFNSSVAGFSLNALLYVLSISFSGAVFWKLFHP